MKQTTVKKQPFPIPRNETKGKAKHLLQLLGESIFNIFIIVYFIGLIGIFVSLKEQNDKDFNFYTALFVANFLVIVATMYLIIKIIM